MKTLLGRFVRLLRQIWGVAGQVQRDKATSMLEFELKELENIFVMLLFGSFVGLPTPPTAMAFELMPYMEEEIKLMISRADLAQDPLGNLLGMLEID
ncbi:hypothetical protein [Sediminispirochaeta smaragdinae]|jgi:hypothetical protein|uniref:Uncharacterized protein n=1 Tax=Sediminispirochaeta smaragdinae (strain DSM 11293 / JCM 15392 / SEBR 4228) TaxID=573413 RepID=E1R3V1_SEDSS|nr:hypothetical protein [Sediminispirochaeta smaragdinae]ADK82072.1 conserved hypothetical protein [Sediminispirochaeta smaragdinae DSM 11293]